MKAALPALFALAAALLFPRTARAHDPYESWSSGTLFPDKLQVDVTMAQATALRLVDPERNLRGLTPEVFAQHRALFEREAASLYVVTAGRSRLAPQKIAAELTEENDVVFKLTFPRPAPGRLHFHAAFLVKLGEGYGGIIELSDNANKQIGWDQLSWANPNFEVEAPAAATPAPRK